MNVTYRIRDKKVVTVFFLTYPLTNNKVRMSIIGFNNVAGNYIYIHLCI